MAGDNSNLIAAKRAKNDELYTQYRDIEDEMSAYVEFNPDVFRDKTVLLPCDDPEWSNFTKYFVANFERFGLKKLISTSYAKSAGSRQPKLFERESPLFDSDTHGKLFTLTRDKDGSGRIEFSGYLEGDGDFRSAEVKAIRDEADVIITNPPFSLFREFLAWVLMENQKKFIIIGSINAVTYKVLSPLIKDELVWLGSTHPREFIQRDGTVKKFGNICWYTNLGVKKRHDTTRLKLDTMAHNLKFNKKLRKKFEKDYGKLEYPHYDNYDAIEVPFVNAIPCDYDGVMGVPITFIGNYSTDQFEVLGCSEAHSRPSCFQSDCVMEPSVNGRNVFRRIFIRNKHPEL